MRVIITRTLIIVTTVLITDSLIFIFQMRRLRLGVYQSALVPHSAVTNSSQVQVADSDGARKSNFIQKASRLRRWWTCVSEKHLNLS